MTDNQYTQYDHIATPVFVLVPDQDGVPRYATLNRIALDRAGLTREQVVGATAIEIFPGRFGRTAFSRQCAAVRSCKLTKYDIELPMAEGTRWYRTTLHPVLDPQGALLHIVGTSEETTGQHQAEELAVQMQTAQAELAQFVSIAAHDLRTPMRHVKFMAELLREDFVDMGDGKIDLIDQLEDVAAKASELISDVLKHTLANVSSSVPESFDLNQLCENIVGVLDPHGDHQLSWPNCVIKGDKTVFQIVLRNLIDNSLKHGNREALNVTISLSEQSGDNRFVELHLTDDGGGFANPDSAFSQSPAEQARKGFGLQGVQKLVLARNGRIQARNTSHGARVSVRLPGSLESVATPPPLPDIRHVHLRHAT